MAQSFERDPVAVLPNPAAGRYLRTILEAVEGPADDLRPSGLAKRLDVTPASVTEMTDRLAGAGLVEHEPYGGITLTADGIAVARHLQWRQCVVRRYVVEILGVEVPEQAGYAAGVALPAEAIREMARAVALDCRDGCDDRVWEQDCDGSVAVRSEEGEPVTDGASGPDPS
jgi:DtxR family Mn-dependent transcriptional regulator